MDDQVDTEFEEALEVIYRPSVIDTELFNKNELKKLQLCLNNIFMEIDDGLEASTSGCLKKLDNYLEFVKLMEEKVKTDQSNATKLIKQKSMLHYLEQSNQTSAEKNLLNIYKEIIEQYEKKFGMMINVLKEDPENYEIELKFIFNNIECPYNIILVFDMIKQYLIDFNAKSFCSLKKEKELKNEYANDGDLSKLIYCLRQELKKKINN